MNAIEQAERDALSKFAARAGIRRIRQLLAQGEHNPAVQKELSALTSRAGDLLTGRNLPHGSQLRVLGAGGEGVAQHVLTPQGQKVMKIHDPSAMAYSPNVIANKNKLVGQQIPGFANIESKHTMPGKVQGKQVPGYMNEYVPGQTMSKEDFASGKGQSVLQRGQQGVGNIELADLNRTNLKTTPSGDVKAIDYMPVDKEHMLPAAQRGRANVLNENIDPSSPTFQSFNVNRPGHTSLQQQMGSKATERQYAGKLLNQAYTPAPTAPATVRPGAINNQATVRPGAVNKVPPMNSPALAAPKVPSFAMDSTELHPAQIPQRPQYTVRPSAMPSG